MARLDKAYKAFYRRLKLGQAPGFPRFQGRDRYHSFTYKQYGFGTRLDNGFLVLSKIGRVAVRWSRPLEGTPKTVTISKEADGWYVILSCADVPVHPLTPTGRDTGIDLGLNVFIVTAEGEVVENPRHYRRGEKKLAKAQRRVSKRKKGSARRREAVAASSERIRRCSGNAPTSTTRPRWRCCASTTSLDLEDLRGRQPGAGPVTSPSPSADAGWAQFRTILEAKAACAGRRVDRCATRLLRPRDRQRLWGGACPRV